MRIRSGPALGWFRWFAFVYDFLNAAESVEWPEIRRLKNFRPLGICEFES